MRIRRHRTAAGHFRQFLPFLLQPQIVGPHAGHNICPLNAFAVAAGAESGNPLRNGGMVCGHGGVQAVHVFVCSAVVRGIVEKFQFFVFGIRVENKSFLFRAARAGSLRLDRRNFLFFFRLCFG